MSQQKVEAYKKTKSQRAKNAKKETRKMWIEIMLVALVVIAGIVWFAVSAITKNVSENATVPTYTINTEAVDDYIEGLSATDSADAAEASEEASETTSEAAE